MDLKFCPLCGSGLRMAEIDGRERVGCLSERCDYVFWDNPTPVVAAIVELDGAVILVRNRAWPEKIFGLVTGFLEKGESPEEGILREIREELGIKGKIVLGEELIEMKAVRPEKLRPWRFGTGYAVQDWLDKRNETGTG